MRHGIVLRLSLFFLIANSAVFAFCKENSNPAKFTGAGSGIKAPQFLPYVVEEGLGINETEVKQQLLLMVRELSPVPPSWEVSNSLQLWNGLRLLTNNTELSSRSSSDNSSHVDWSIFSLDIGPEAPDTQGYFTQGWLVWPPKGYVFPFSTVKLMGLGLIELELGLLPQVFEEFEFALLGCARLVEARVPATQGNGSFDVPAAPVQFVRYIRFSSITITDCPIGGTVDLSPESLYFWDGLKKLVFTNLSMTGSLEIPSQFEQRFIPVRLGDNSLDTQLVVDARGNNWGTLLLPSPEYIPFVTDREDFSQVVEGGPTTSAKGLSILVDSGIPRVFMYTSQQAQQASGGTYKLTDTKTVLCAEMEYLTPNPYHTVVKGVDILQLMSVSSDSALGYDFRLTSWYGFVGFPVSGFNARGYTVSSETGIISPSSAITSFFSQILFFSLAQSSLADLYRGQYLVRNVARQQSLTLVATGRDEGFYNITFSEDACGESVLDFTGFFSSGQLLNGNITASASRKASKRIVLLEIRLKRESIQLTKYSTGQPSKTCTYQQDLRFHSSGQVINSFSILFSLRPCFPEYLLANTNASSFDGQEREFFSQLYTNQLALWGYQYARTTIFRQNTINRLSVLSLLMNESSNFNFTSQNISWVVPEGDYVGFTPQGEMVTLRVADPGNGGYFEIATSADDRVICEIPSLYSPSSVVERSSVQTTLLQYFSPYLSAIHNAVDSKHIFQLTADSASAWNSPIASCLKSSTSKKSLTNASLENITCSLEKNVFHPPSSRCLGHPSVVLRYDEAQSKEVTISESSSLLLQLKASSELEGDYLPVPPSTLCANFGSEHQIQVELVITNHSLKARVSNFTFGFWFQEECEVQGGMWYNINTSSVQLGAFLLASRPRCLLKIPELGKTLAGAEILVSTIDSSTILSLTLREEVDVPQSQTNTSQQDDHTPAVVSFTQDGCTSLNNASMCQALNTVLDVSEKIVDGGSPPPGEVGDMEEFSEDNSLLQNLPAEYISTVIEFNHPPLVSVPVPFADPSQCVRWSDSPFPEIIRLSNRRSDDDSAPVQTPSSSSTTGLIPSNPEDNHGEQQRIMQKIQTVCFGFFSALDVSTRREIELQACALTESNCTAVAEIIKLHIQCVMLHGGDPTTPGLMKYPTLPRGFQPSAPFFDHSQTLGDRPERSCTGGVGGATELLTALQLAVTPLSELGVAIRCDASMAQAGSLLLGDVVGCLPSAPNEISKTGNFSSQRPIIIRRHSSAISSSLCTLCQPYTTNIEFSATPLIILLASSMTTALLNFLAQILTPRLRPFLLKVRLFFVRPLLPISPEQKAEYIQFLTRESQPLLVSRLDLIEHCSTVLELLHKIEVRDTEEHAVSDRLADRMMVRGLFDICSETGRLFPLEDLTEVAMGRMSSTNSGGGSNTLKKTTQLQTCLIELRESCLSEALKYIRRAKRENSDDPSLNDRTDDGDDYDDDNNNNGRTRVMMRRRHIEHDTDSDEEELGTGLVSVHNNDDNKESISGRGEEPGNVDLYLASAEDLEDLALKLLDKVKFPRPLLRKEKKTEGCSNHDEQTNRNAYATLRGLLAVYSSLSFIHLYQWTDKLLEPATWYVLLQIIMCFAQVIASGIGTIEVVQYGGKFTQLPIGASRFALYQNFYFELINSGFFTGLIANLIFLRWRRIQTLVSAGHVSVLRKILRVILTVVLRFEVVLGAFYLIPVLFTHVLPGFFIFCPVMLLLALFWTLSLKIVQMLPAVVAERKQIIRDNGREEIERVVVLKSKSNLFRLVVALLVRGLQVLLITLILQFSFNYALLFVYPDYFPWFSSRTAPGTYAALGDLKSTVVKFSFDSSRRYVEVLLVDYFRRTWTCYFKTSTFGLMIQTILALIGV